MGDGVREGRVRESVGPFGAGERERERERERE